MFLKRWPGSPADASGAWTKESPRPAIETRVGKDRSWWPSSTLGFERMGINAAQRKHWRSTPRPHPPGHLKPHRYRMSAWSSCILDPLWILNLHRILTRSAHLCSYTWAHTTPHPPQPVFFSFPPHVPTSSSDPDLASWPLKGRGGHRLWKWWLKLSYFPPNTSLTYCSPPLSSFSEQQSKSSLSDKTKC